MRKSDREITCRETIDSVIRECQVCRLAFAADNEPYLIPISFGYDGQALYFHTAEAGRKIDFVTANSRVCFEFDCNVKLVTHPENACKWTTSFQSVVGYGHMTELTDVEDKKHGLNQIMIQYSGKTWDFNVAVLSRTRIWKLEIDSVTGKQS